MARHFLAVLGTGLYSDCVYYLGTKESTPTSYVQNALLELLVGELNKEDKITIFLTEGERGARNLNWENRKFSERELKNNQTLKTGDIKIGLKEVLEKSYNIEQINDVDIPEGKTKEQLWKTFEIIFNEIREGDEVIFDITYGFRSIPMQVMMILQYAKVLKNIKISGIYYGAFEAGEVNGESKEKRVPIFDLTEYNEMLEWSSAAESFVKYGNGNQLKDLFEQINAKFKREGNRELNKFNACVHDIANITNCLETSRGKQTTTSNANTKSIQNAYHQLKSNIENLRNMEKTEKSNEKPSVEKAIRPLLEKAASSVSIFDVQDNLHTGIAAVRWAIDKNLTQQGFTALEETIKTYICIKYGLIEELEFSREQIVKRIINLMSHKGKKPNREEIYEQWSKGITDEVKRNWLNKKLDRERSMERQKIKQDEITAHKNNITEGNLTEEDKKWIGEQIAIAEAIIKNIPFDYVALSRSVSELRNNINHFGFQINDMDYKTLQKRIKEKYNEFLEFVKKDYPEVEQMQYR